MGETTEAKVGRKQAAQILIMKVLIDTYGQRGTERASEDIITLLDGLGILKEDTAELITVRLHKGVLPVEETDPEENGHHFRRPVKHG